MNSRDLEVVLPLDVVGAGDLDVELDHLGELRQQVAVDLLRLGELPLADEGAGLLQLLGDHLVRVGRGLLHDGFHHRQPLHLLERHRHPPRLVALEREVDVPVAPAKAGDRPLALLVRLRAETAVLGGQEQLHAHVRQRLAGFVRHLAGQAPLSAPPLCPRRAASARARALPAPPPSRDTASPLLSLPRMKNQDSGFRIQGRVEPVPDRSPQSLSQRQREGVRTKGGAAAAAPPG